jgi:DNA transformation protein and related proteins
MAGKQQKAARGPDSFTTYVLDQLSALGAVEARRVFSGQGLYWRDQIFALIHRGRLYFRVADETRPGYVARGSVPFEPMPGHVMAGYHEVPGTVLEDAEETVAWARTAWALPRGAARRKRAARKTAKRAVAKKAAKRPGKR